MNAVSKAAAARGPARALALLAAAAVMLGLFTVLRVHAAGQTLLALTLLVVLALAVWTYSSTRTHALRYLLPGIAAAAIFVIFPMLYTVGMGFTNTSSQNLLEPDAARAYLLDQATPALDSGRDFTLHPQGERFVLRLPGTEANAQTWLTLPLALLLAPDTASAPPVVAPLQSADDTSLAPALPLRAVVQRLPALRSLSLTTPDGRTLKLTGLRSFAQMQPLFAAQADGSLTDTLTRVNYQPDNSSGFYTSADGDRLLPGYRVAVGLRHYVTVFSEDKFRQPFLSVFAWTVMFAALSVVLAAGLGLLLSVLLNWPALPCKGAYRLVLFLPYAVPGFISILVFKGLFNQNLGEINLILHGLFGIRPAWFSEPLLAKAMLLIVNVWLGFPYMMILCTGLIKSIPADLYEASAIAGAGPWANFRHITLPLILKPLSPLLISAFAFNFNNFVLISLLTGGRPDQLDTTLPAGTTDILVSYTWRIAFQDSGQQFGLASAISTLIFLIVAAITLLQLRFTRPAGDSR